ncbi:MAG TPA: metallophosphoesterase, partial [Elusimicrobiales bacterium]|nr:metallophosphoesterase [Elusimicrobiales bacterium]
HLGSLLGAKWLAARVAQVQAFRPDLIVLLGDTYDGRSFSAQEFVAELKGFSAPLGVWAVLGNHEHYRDREKHLVSFERAGIHVLSDQAVALRPGLVLAGVDDLTIRKRQGSAPAHLQKTLSGRPPGAAVLLSHSPLYEDEAARLGTGLMLSGHTHDGQLWPFNYLVMREYPVVSGVYKTGGLTLIVCRGTGTWGLRMRLWRRGEILRVTLRSPDAKNIKN